MYHLENLVRMNMIESRSVKWKNTYRKEYKSKNLVLVIDFGGSDTGSEDNDETAGTSC